MPIALPSLGARRAAGYTAATALVATGLAIPMGAAMVASTASAACLDGIQYSIGNHHRDFRMVKGTEITFTKPGRHSVKITKATTLSARYSSSTAKEKEGILRAVQETFPKVRAQVKVTRGHKVKFSSHADEVVTVWYGSNGDSVTWKKLDVDSDCSSEVLKTGTATFPRKNLDWLFAVAVE